MSYKLLELTTEIAASFVTNNYVAQSQLPALIVAIHSALSTVDAAPTPAAIPEATFKRTPAQIRKSITPDALISFINGKPYRTLKRHITTHGETIASYKEKYGLPADYPTTAPNYSATRSALAKSLRSEGANELNRNLQFRAPSRTGRPSKAKGSH